MSYGTGAIEIKSGYGLSVAAELKMLRVIKKLKATNKIKIKATFLGAHAFPLAYKENPDIVRFDLLHESHDEARSKAQRHAEPEPPRCFQGTGSSGAFVLVASRLLVII